MPEFLNPYGGRTLGREMLMEELIRAIRQNIAAEQEAVHLYSAHAEVAGHALARQVLLDIANEERVHIGEFQRLLEILSGDEVAWQAKGREEVDAMAAGAGDDSSGDGSRVATIGSLREQGEAT